MADLQGSEPLHRNRQDGDSADYGPGLASAQQLGQRMAELAHGVTVTAYAQRRRQGVNGFLQSQIQQAELLGTAKAEIELELRRRLVVDTARRLVVLGGPASVIGCLFFGWGVLAVTVPAAVLLSLFLGLRH